MAIFPLTVREHDPFAPDQPCQHLGRLTQSTDNFRFFRCERTGRERAIRAEYSHLFPCPSCADYVDNTWPKGWREVEA